jgi:hypothetical protein
MYGAAQSLADEPLESSVATPWKGVIVCLVLNFIFTLPFTCLETIGPPYGRAVCVQDLTVCLADTRARIRTCSGR